MRRSLLAATLPLVIGLAACGDDDDDSATAAAARTDAEYCAGLEGLPDDGGPTEAFFEAHPDPTMTDWAGGLPDIIARSKDTRDHFAEVEPSPGLGDERQAVLDALDAVTRSFGASLDAAEAGDQAAFDAEEAKNQDENVPALMTAFEEIETACGDGE